jgi:hypothetical protein
MQETPSTPWWVDMEEAMQDREALLDRREDNLSFLVGKER